ncbi:MAG: tetratricopeptide repeat protein [Cyclobacteriaceae bacterium]
MGDSLKILMSLHAIGDAKMELGEIKNGIDRMKHALRIARRNSFQEREVYILSNLAIAYYRSLRFDSALHYNLESLDLRQRFGYEDLSALLNNIGLIYMEMQDYKTALEYIDRAVQRFPDESHPSEFEIFLINQGECYMYLGLKELALEKYEDALAYCQGKCSQFRWSVVYLSYALGLMNNAEFQKSEYYLDQVIKLSNEGNDKRYLIRGLRAKAEIRILMGKLEDAKRYIEMASSLTNATDLVQERLQNLEIQKQIYRALADHSLATDVQSEQIEIMNTALKGPVVSSLSKAIVEFNERDNLALIKSQLDLISSQERKESQHTTLLLLIIGLLILSIAVSVVLYNGVRTRNRIRKILKARIGDRNSELNSSPELKSLQIDSEVLNSIRLLQTLTKTESGNSLSGQASLHLVKIEEELSRITNLLNRYQR